MKDFNIASILGKILIGFPIILTFFFSYFIPIFALNDNDMSNIAQFTCLFLGIDTFIGIIYRKIFKLKKDDLIPLIQSTLILFIAIILSTFIYKINLSTLTIILILLVNIGHSLLTRYLQRTSNKLDEILDELEDDLNDEDD